MVRGRLRNGKKMCAVVLVDDYEKLITSKEMIEKTVGFHMALMEMSWAC